MADDSRVRKQLLDLINDQQADIESFLHRTRPRRNLLNNTAVVCSSLAAAFAAFPAMAGPKQTQETARDLGLDNAAQLWQPLCIGAFVVALVAAVAANLSRTQDLPARISAAEACNAELKGLATLLTFKHLSVQEAVELYQQYVLKVPFVDDRDVVETDRKPARAAAGRRGPRSRPVRTGDGPAGPEGNGKAQRRG